MSAPHCPREYSMSQKEAEDRLREAVSFNDLETLIMLIQRGTNVNSKNAVNEWTALHWACKRNNSEAARILLGNGADPTMKNADGKMPGELSTNSTIRSMCGVTEPVEENGSSDAPDFVPNYLAHPQLSYRVDMGPSRFATNRSPAGMSGSIFSEAELVVKVRIAGVEEYFVEIDLPKTDLTYETLLTTACRELEIQDPRKVKRLVKLPNTLIRRDKDVSRLRDFQEIELLMH